MTRLSLRHTTGLVAAALLVPLLTSCSDEKSDADLVIYSGRNEDLVGSFIEDFEKQEDIKVDVRYGDTAELSAQLLEEGDKTPAEVFFSQDAGALGVLSDEGMLAELDSADLELVPETYRSSATDWVGVTGRVRVLAYDPETVTEQELPDDVLELTGDEWAGKVAIAPTNASFQSFVTALRVTEGEDVAREFLTGLVENDAQIYENNLAILDALEAGEVTVGLTNHYYLHERKLEVGAENVRTQLKFLPPGSAGALVNVAGVGILEGAGDNEHAQAFVDYLLSDTVQEKFVETTGEYPLLPVTGPEGLPSLEELRGGAGMDLGELDSLDQTVDLLVEVGLI